MTLKEKFKTNVSINTSGEADRFANQCKEIADDYAIEFANWALNNRAQIWRIPPITDEQVLEIFKKEKGL
jgi:hypothetical protein